MPIRTLWLTDFRNYTELEVDLSPGLTALLGANGQGKTNVLEALGWLATLSSFRGASDEALVRDGAAFAVVRALTERDGHDLLIEAQLQPNGRNRVLVNRQPLRRARDLLGSLRVTIFAPDDLAVVKAGPAERRRFLDDALVALRPKNDLLRGELDRVLRQRNALLRQCAGELDDATAFTLDVWDAKLGQTGEDLARARTKLLERLQPILATSYDQLARTAARVTARYVAPWSATGLAAALRASRLEDLRRRTTTVGPHRDDVTFTINGLPARSHGSQGEQRTLALALRLAVHRIVTEETGFPPLLLLDDVFSELDPARGDALLANLPAGQILLTSATHLPRRARPDLVLEVGDGTIRPAV